MSVVPLRPDDEVSNAETVEYRAALRNVFPSRYSAVLHFGAVNAAGISAIIGASLLLEDVKPIEWLTIPAVFLFANWVEYMAHKGPMHHKRDLAEIVFRRHTMQHHEYYRHDNMGMGSARDCYLIFFPVWAIFLVFGVASVPFFITWMLTNTNVAGLFLMVSIGYYLLYEWLHFVYHVPERYWIGRIGIIRKLRQHHQAHHNHALMQKYNFNITFPICDYVFGTAWRDHDGPRRQS
jgi:hypothetical protein